MPQSHAPRRTADAKNRASEAAPCPCGGQPAGVGYRDCCARLIEARLPAPNAESLMRSRYTAYVYENFAYLRQSWDPQTCPADLGDRPRDQAQPNWLGLTIKRHTIIDDHHAEVEFVARYKIGGRAQRIHEISQFTRMDDHWLYVTGELFD